MKKNYNMQVTGKFSYLTSVNADNLKEAEHKALKNFCFDSKVLSEDPEIWIDFEGPFEAQKARFIN